MNKRLGIICCEDAEKWGGPDGGRFMMTMFQNHPGEPVEYFKATEGKLPDPEKLIEYKGFVLSGSHYSVNDTHSWVTELEKFVQDVFRFQENNRNSCPKLAGICFGHQMMAKAAGAKVIKNELGKFIFGLGKVDVSEDMMAKDYYKDVLGNDDAFVMFESHGEEVVDIPSDTTTTIKCVGSSDNCKNEILIYGDGGEGGLSFQGHMEITNEQCVEKILPAIRKAGLYSEQDEIELKEQLVSVTNQREQIVEVIKNYLK